MKTIKYMMGKATFSSITGWPIAFVANLIFLPLFIPMLQENPVGASLTIGALFGVISIFRLFIIDWVEDRYGLNIKPSHLIRELFNR